MTFNVEANHHSNNESSQMSDITGSAGGEEATMNSNQFSNPSQMIMNGGEDANNDFSKKIYKAKRFKPQP